MNLWHELKEWQTLVSGLMAVAATFLGAILLWKQTAQTKATNEDQRQRALDRARTLAQFKLSELYTSIEDFAKEIAYILANGERLEPNEFTGWPQSALEALTNIQLHCAPNERAQFGTLFKKMQVLQSRLIGHEKNEIAVDNFNRITWLLNACMLVEVRSAVGALFDYCRFHINDFPDFNKSLPEVETTLTFWNIDLEGNAGDNMSDVAFVRRWLERALKANATVSWHSKPIRD